MSLKDYTPAEAFPVGDYIRDELEARGWTTRDLAQRMGGDAAVNELSIEFLIHCGNRKGLTLSQSDANGLAAAFGSSAELWMDIDAVYQRYKTKGPTP